MTDQPPVQPASTTLAPPAKPGVGAAIAQDIATGEAVLNDVALAGGPAAVAKAVAHEAGTTFMSKLAELEEGARLKVLDDLGFIEGVYKESPFAFFGGVALGALVALGGVALFYGVFH